MLDRSRSVTWVVIPSAMLENCLLKKERLTTHGMHNIGNIMNVTAEFQKRISLQTNRKKDTAASCLVAKKYTSEVWVRPRRASPHAVMIV